MSENEERALAAAVGRLLALHGWRLATAESCTGGLVGHWVTEIAGSSAYYRGGVVAYDNEIKEGLLGVPDTVLQRHGAVSAEAALHLAHGARRLLRSEVGLAVTGVAGPGGGTAAKPVGTVHVAVVTPGGEWSEQHHWRLDRSGNKRLSALAALRLLAAHLN